jgi:CBS domain-containing protein
MTRSVLCVSEDQALSEAANMMVNRDVEQLPVVREGELVGFVTRESILRALHGVREGPSSDKEESESST